MESKKVKEIKKALKCCSEGKCEKCLIGKKDIRKCVDILLKDTLTLINELESENEKLKDNKSRCVSCHKDITKELPKIDSYGNHYCMDCYLKKSKQEVVGAQLRLKHFAEIFKQKCIDGGIFPAFVARKLEETLKEFIPDESNN